MIKFKELPATPGSLEPSHELQEILRTGNNEDINRVAVGLGATILLNVDPPTPDRAVAVAYPIVAEQDLSTNRKVTFMQAILKGAIEQAIRVPAG